MELAEVAAVDFRAGCKVDNCRPDEVYKRDRCCLGGLESELAKMDVARKERRRGVKRVSHRGDIRPPQLRGEVASEQLAGPLGLFVRQCVRDIPEVAGAKPVVVAAVVVEHLDEELKEPAVFGAI